MNQTCVMHRICVPVCFPCGVSVGAERVGNSSTISRDGRDRPIVRGSSWAGVLRRELQRRDPKLVAWFGDAQGDRDGAPPRCHITIHDSVLFGAPERLASSVIRTHNAVDRHDGAPVDGALFTVEAAAPGASGTLEAWITAVPDDDQQVKALANGIAAVFARGVMVGGSRLADWVSADWTMPRASRGNASTCGSHQPWPSGSIFDRVDRRMAARRSSWRAPPCLARLRRTLR